MEQPYIACIFICLEKGQNMSPVDRAIAIAGVGLKGDRYERGTGTHSGKDNRGKPGVCMRQVTFISSQQIEEANKLIGASYRHVVSHVRAWQTRRNILVGGRINLPSLIGKEFAFGDVLFRGFEDCTPCKIPGRMLGMPEDGAPFEKAFQGLGGIRAEILTDGVIRAGDRFFDPSVERLRL